MSKIYEALPGKPAKFNITATRNDTFVYKIRGWNDDGTPYDFTGHTFKLQVKKKREDSETPVIDIPDGDFTITQDSIGSNAGVNNIIEISHDESNMDVTPRDYVFDLELTDASSNVFTFAKELDYFRVEQDVSQ